MTDPRTALFPKWLMGALACAIAMGAHAADPAANLSKAANASEGGATQSPPVQAAPAAQPSPSSLPAAAPVAAGSSKSKSSAKSTAAPRPKPAPKAKVAPADEPSTLILSDTLHYDDIKKTSVFTGNVVMTRGLLTLHSDALTMHQEPDGTQFGTATASPGKMVTIRQERPETFELVVGTGLRAEYDSKKSQFDLIGQAVVTRYVCGKPFDSIRGDRVRYNDKAGTYEAQGGPNSSAAGGRVRSIAESRAKSDAAAASCRPPASGAGAAGAAGTDAADPGKAPSAPVSKPAAARTSKKH